MANYLIVQDEAGFAFENNEEFVRNIPKTDLHVHLDGSLRISTLLELAQQLGIELPADSEEGLKETLLKEHFDDLEEYLNVFHYPVEIIKKGGLPVLERIAYELAIDCFEEGVRYFECRFSPQMFAEMAPDGKSNIQDILEAVDQGFSRAKQEYENLPSQYNYGFEYGIIVCVMRGHVQKWAQYFKDFWAKHEGKEPREICGLLAEDVVNEAVAAKNQRGVRSIVGVDLACTEAGFPARIYRTAFETARRNFLGTTVHAGEDYGPESMYEAVMETHAERIGHGFNLFSPDTCDGTVQSPEQFVKELAEYFASREIHLEVCLTSNEQTMASLRGHLHQHSMKKMINSGMSVSINTDNRLISRTNMCREISRAVQAFQLNRQQLRSIILEGLRKSFFPGEYNEKCTFLEHMERHYRSVENTFYGYNSSKRSLPGVNAWGEI